MIYSGVNYNNKTWKQQQQQQQLEINILRCRLPAAKIILQRDLYNFNIYTL